MGLSFGGAAGGTNSNSTSSSVQNNTYAPGQTGVQSDLGTTLSQDLAASNSGTLTPGNTAALTSANDSTNQNAAGLTGRVTQFLAQRGFGQSGQTGQADLQGELSRESQIGTNTANAQANQGTQNSSNLLAALNYAFTSLGSTASGTSTGSTTGWGVGAGVGGTPSQFSSAFQ
jgi:hypothetical protein